MINKLLIITELSLVWLNLDSQIATKTQQFLPLFSEKNIAYCPLYTMSQIIPLTLKVYNFVKLKIRKKIWES